MRPAAKKLEPAPYSRDRIRPPQPFPGSIFNRDGVAWDGRRPPLRMTAMAQCPYRKLVAQPGWRSVFWVWLLVDHATFDAVPPYAIRRAKMLIEDGFALLILARSPEPIRSVGGGLAAWCATLQTGGSSDLRDWETETARG